MLTTDKSRLRSRALKYQLQFHKLLLNAVKASASAIVVAAAVVLRINEKERKKWYKQINDC